MCHYDPDIALSWAIKDMRAKENRSRGDEVTGKRKRAMKDSVKANILAKENMILALRADSSPPPVLQDRTDSSNQPAKKRRVSSDRSVVHDCIVPLSDRRASRSASRSTSTFHSSPIPDS